MSLTTLPMALTLDESQLSSRFYLDNMSEGLYDMDNIGLMLECEDDQSYALPQHHTNGLQLHTSTNVSMRISFSNGGSGGSLSCRYCQCNFLSEAHLMDHMHKFHNDESGDEDADDDQGMEEDHDDDDYDDDHGEGIPGMMSVEKIAEIVKTPVTFPGYLKMATTMHGNVKKSVSSPGYVKTKATAATNVKPPVANSGYSKPAVTSPGIVKTAAITPGHIKTAAMSPGLIKTAVSSGKVKTIALSPNKIKPAVTSPGYITAIASPTHGVITSPAPVYTNGSDTAILSPHTSPNSTPNPNQVTDLKTLKRKTSTAASDAFSAPRLTLTIKKSKSTYEVHRDEETSVPVSPVTQMREENCDVQSDSANETIDVESSSPYSSPSSEKNEVKVVANGRKKASGKFVCDQCQKSYVSKYALKRHIATHSDERPFVCTFPDCKGAFKLKSRLTDHIRYVHKRKTPRTVNRSKSVPDTSTSSLAQALLSPSSLSLPGSVALTSTSDVAEQTPGEAVSNGKPSSKTKLYKCTVANCNREFRDSYNLASHMCLHTGRMPFKCSMCSFSTIQKASLDWHVQAKHPKS